MPKSRFAASDGRSVAHGERVDLPFSAARSPEYPQGAPEQKRPSPSRQPSVMYTCACVLIANRTRSASAAARSRQCAANFCARLGVAGALKSPPFL
ncbi:hypothetical protein MRX96_005617 [Rhipicephalus microplus]